MSKISTCLMASLSPWERGKLARFASFMLTPPLPHSFSWFFNLSIYSYKPKNRHLKILLFPRWIKQICASLVLFWVHVARPVDNHRGKPHEYLACFCFAYSNTG